MERDKIADSLDRNLTSPNCPDSNGEAANLVDGLYRIADSLDRNFTNPDHSCEGMGDRGNVVDALYEIARGLFAVAKAIKETT